MARVGFEPRSCRLRSWRFNHSTTLPTTNSLKNYEPAWEVRKAVSQDKKLQWYFKKKIGKRCCKLNGRNWSEGETKTRKIKIISETKKNKFEGRIMQFEPKMFRLERETDCSGGEGGEANQKGRALLFWKSNVLWPP